jgi:hypothetical protein
MFLQLTLIRHFEAERDGCIAWRTMVRQWWRV